MKVTKTGSRILIEVDLIPEASAPMSKSGKSKVGFTSNGFRFEQGLGIGLNIIYSKKGKENE